jgi:hypothetical protein
MVAIPLYIGTGLINLAHKDLGAGKIAGSARSYYIKGPDDYDRPAACDSK